MTKSWQFETDKEADVESRCKYYNLSQRLVGVYTVPVNDGAGPLNGKMTYTQEFPTPPICHEAAKTIESLVDLLDRVYSHVGNHQPPNRRHVLPPGLRDEIRDVLNFTKGD